MTELPTTFGKYYLTEKLATGGMAEIYLAKLIGPGGFEKQLVIKQIHPKLTGQRQFVDMFVAEAKTLVTLTHGNIVPVYELGVVDETYFIAMDYIDGPTLYRLTETMARRDARMEPALAAWITARMLEGLDYAHRKGEGVVHRDLSPRNVMLSRDGEVKLVDFGIAVSLGEPGEGDGGQSAPTGSFPYMSPEQVRRDGLTPQTDLFSVGVLMWEMVAGRRLFHRADQDATLAAVLREDIPRPSSVRPEVPAKLDEVVMRALERDRGARWQHASDMLAAINKYLYSLDTTPGPRDVAALVAKFCPPETRRLPTHLEAEHGSDADEDSGPAPAGPSTAVIPRDGAAKGPSTAVIPRDGAARGRPQRHKSFATNIDIAPLLDEDGRLSRPSGKIPTVVAGDPVSTRPSAQRPAATPPLDTQPSAKSAESTGASATEEDDSEPAAPQRSRRMAAVEEPIQRPAPAPLPVPGREPPSRAVLVLAGIGMLGLGVAAIVMFFQSRDRVLASDRQDAGVMVTRDAASLPDTLVEPPVLVDAATAPIDAPPSPPSAHDAGARHAVDATLAVVPRVDAGATAVDASVTAPSGTATLKVGADPWGEIYVDGKLVGRTPRELVVPAGHHTVEIVFPAETPPRKQTFSVDLGAGETKPLQADFGS